MVPLKSKKPSAIRDAYRKVATDMGREFKTEFLKQMESDGTYVDPAAVEAPHQRGITERHGKTFKFMLMKAMDTYNCQTIEEWEALVDMVVMTKTGYYKPMASLPCKEFWVSHHAYPAAFYQEMMAIERDRVWPD